MSGLVRLYPRAWRDRYEEEFLALLEARPPTSLDRLDIVRGALDARLHPQVRRSEDPAPTPADRGPDDWLVARRLGYGALVGAGAWLLAWWLAANGPMIYDGYGGYRDGSAGLPFVLVAVVLLAGGLIGQLIRLPAARLARAGAIFAIVFLIVWSFGPWLVHFGGLGLLGLVAFAVGARRSAGWSGAATAAVLGGCVGIFALVPLMMGLVDLGIAGDGSEQIAYLALGLLAVPIWLGIGGSLVAARRPSSAA
jgi:hypothetical protein